MSDGGFLEQSKHTNKTGLTIVIAGHAIVLTALALAPPEAIQRITFLPTIATSIPEPAPPPPDQPPPQPREQATQERATMADPIVKTAGDPVLTADPRPIPTTDPQPLPPQALPEPLFIAASIEPSAMARFQPDYPSDLIRADIEGTATVRVLIGADGRVKTVELVNAAHPRFFEATKRQALNKWRFKPATRGGTPQESWKVMNVRFEMTNAR